MRFLLKLCLLVLLTQSCWAETIQELSWLSGDWSNDRTEEHWSLPRAKSMLGYGRSFADGKLAFFEFLRLSEKDGKIVLWASPVGQSLTPFFMEKMGERSVLFANPEHDFPKYIEYRNEGQALHVKISDGEGKVDSWTLYRR